MYKLALDSFIFSFVFNVVLGHGDLNQRRR